jgi:phosphomethylpyrimidine synthase
VFLTDGELQVPVREIAVGGGNPPVRVYDTTGPQGDDGVGHDVQRGLPRLRLPWIERRQARGDNNFSQLHYARRAR